MLANHLGRDEILVYIALPLLMPYTTYGLSFLLPGTDPTSFTHLFTYR